MKKLNSLLIFVSLLFTMQVVKSQDKIQFGNKTFFIPTPKGFYEITKLKSEWKKNANYFVGEGAINFGFFVSKETLEELRNSKYFEINGDYYFLNFDNQLELSSKDFNDLKDLLKKTNVTDKNLREINEYLKTNGDSIGKIFVNNRKLQVGGLLFLDAFNESKNTISFSFISKREAIINGKKVSDYKFGCLSYIYINGSLLYATGFSLQEISKAKNFHADWINKILSKNPNN